MSDVLETVLLLALPASGKSEVRRFLEHQSPKTCTDRFHMGPTVQLDDYPYVHIMRCIDDIREERGEERIFFEAADRSFKTSLDWLTLIALLNEDFEDLKKLAKRAPEDSAKWMLQRYDDARRAVGGEVIFENLALSENAALCEKLKEETDLLISDWNGALPKSCDGKTTVIEFSRGGAHGASMPLPKDFGYAHSLAALSADILRSASILYIWVTPEISRAKNLERAKPGADGSILFHGVPEHVMRYDYGCDDMAYLLEQSDREGTVKVVKGGEVFYLPAARLDNREDLTTFVRGDADAWDEGNVSRLRDALSKATEIISR